MAPERDPVHTADGRVSQTDTHAQDLKSLNRDVLDDLAKELDTPGRTEPKIKKEELAERIAQAHDKDTVKRAIRKVTRWRRLKIWLKKNQLPIAVAGAIIGVASLLLALVSIAAPYVYPPPLPPQPPTEFDADQLFAERYGDFSSWHDQPNQEFSFEEVPITPADSARLVDILLEYGTTHIRFDESRTSLADSFLKELSRIPNLQLLNATDSTDLTDISCLSGCVNLTHLYLGGTGVVDLAGLQGLSALIELDLSRTKIETPADISRLPRLRILRLDGTSVTNVETLRFAPALTSLSIRNATKLEDFGLREVAELHELELEGVPAERITVKDLPKLEKLHIHACAAKELVLEELAWLRNVEIIGNPNIERISLKGCPRMEAVTTGQNKTLTEIALSGMTNMQYLGIKAHPALVRLLLVDLEVRELHVLQNPSLTKARVSSRLVREMLEAEVEGIKVEMAVPSEARSKTHGTNAGGQGGGQGKHSVEGQIEE